MILEPRCGNCCNKVRHNILANFVNSLTFVQQSTNAKNIRQTNKIMITVISSIYLGGFGAANEPDRQVNCFVL